MWSLEFGDFVFKVCGCCGVRVWGLGLREFGLRFSWVVARGFGV